MFGEVAPELLDREQLLGLVHGCARVKGHCAVNAVDVAGYCRDEHIIAKRPDCVE
jgi:hypothetical protein